MSCQRVDMRFLAWWLPRTGGSRFTRRSIPASLRTRRSASRSVRLARFASARCCSTSAMISRRRAGGTPRAARRASSDRAHSGMFEARDTVDGGDEVLPAAGLGGEHAPAGGGEAVVASAPDPRLLHPLPLDPAALLEAVQEGIERGDVVAQRASRALFDQLADLVAVARAGLHERQDEELRAPLLQLPVPQAVCMCHRDMLCIDISKVNCW